MKKKIKLISVCFLLTTSVFITIGYLYRNEILAYTLKKIQNNISQKYDCTFQIGKTKLLGISGIEMKNIYLIPNKADTLLAVNTIKTKINLYEILTGDLQIKNLEMHDGYIQLVKTKNGRNFDAFLKKDKQANSSQKNYAKTTYKLISKVLNLIPTDMKLNNLALKINDMGRKVTLNMHHLQLKNKKLHSTLQVTGNNIKQTWVLDGKANPRAMRSDLRFHSADTSNIIIPYIEERFGIKSNFESIRVQLKGIDFSGDKLHVDGFASINKFKINHPKIASKDVIINKAQFDYKFLLGSNFISIDSSSSIQLNQIKIMPFAEYNTEEDTIYKLKIKIPETKAQDFITSLPKGLFSHFEGMKAIGTFNYTLDFEFNKNKPNKLIFDSQFHKNNLQITKYGEADLDKLNHEFTYRAIESNVLQRPILVGTSNPNFTSFENIPVLLKNAVLTSEDPSFMKHKGFITEAFKQSIIKNIRTKKFARGASTISMQLIKNVFLTREKTLSRKLEEILLVYILENNRITSKERMLEVYFNIIEWGPNIFGISEAAAFYFQKKPQELNLNECLFLASIVPKPKKFMGQFDTTGNQKEYVVKNQTFIKNLMLKRGLLTETDTVGQSIPIQITGNAQSYLKIKTKEKDTLQAIKEIKF